MGKDYNRAIAVGNLVRDPEVKQIKTGARVTTFSIAIGQDYKDNSGTKVEKTSFFNYVAWGKTGEAIAQYFKKGNKICVESQPEQRTWETPEGQKRSAVEFKVDSFHFVGSNKSESSQESTPDLPESNPFSDSDIPF